MDIGRILTRSLEIAWRYKVLWVFGFIMALTGGGGGGNGGSVNYSGSGRDFGFDRDAPGRLPIPDSTLILAIVTALMCLLIVYLVLVLYLRFVARGALVSAVRGIENGATPTLGGAWREGQTYYLRLLGLGFLVNVPLLFLTFTLILLAVLPFIGTLMLASSRIGPGGPSSRDVLTLISGMFGFIALLCAAILCIALVHLVVHPLYEFAVRAIVVEDKRTMEGLSQGWSRIRANLGQVIVLYIVLIGARIGWSMLTLALSIPIGLAALGVVLLTAQSSILTAVALGLALGLPLIVLFIFLEGLFQVFESNVWTEGYLALTAPVPYGPTHLA